MSINLTPTNPTFPSVTIQGILFTAKRFGQFPTITYVNGGTAGSELVTMDASFNITIKIANGVSTNTQIVAALNATAGMYTNSLAPGDVCFASTSSGSTTPTCYSVPLLGGLVATYASVTIGALLVKANSTGTAGNSITVQLLGDFNFTVTTVTDGTHLVVSSTAGLIAGSPIQQGVHSTTVTTVTDGTHLVVGSTTGWVGSGAAATSVVTPGSEPAVQVSTAITVQVHPRPFPETNPTDSNIYTTPFNVLTAINAISSVTVGVTFTGRVGSWISTNALATFTLSGGAAAVAATTGAVNGLTCAANATGVAANGVTVTLIPGGTAGSEVVVDLMNGSFTVQIQDGVSTPTQVAAALNADTVFTASYTATESSSTAMRAVYQDTLSGAAGPAANGGFYMDSATTTLTTSFQWMPFGNQMTAIHVENDDPSGSNTIIGSWDGINTHFILAANTSREFNGATKSAVYLKYGTGAPAYKIWAVLVG